MRRGPFSLNAFKSIDAFGKTLEDVKVRTKTGASLTLVSITLILLLTLVEYLDYRSVYLDTDIGVYKAKSDRITVNFNVTFPRVPCFLISVDATDVSGEHMRSISHNVVKIKTDRYGVAIPGQQLGVSDLTNDLAKIEKLRSPTYCGSCYGGSLPKGGCCQTCEDVRKAYEERGWAFTEPDKIEQCVTEGWKEKLIGQEKSGCQLTGRIRLRKVASDLSFSYGKSFTKDGYHTQELVPYLAGTHFDFGHRFEWLHFESDDEYDPKMKQVAYKVKERLGVALNPMDKYGYHYEERFARQRSNLHDPSFQYFIKVVSNTFHTLNDEMVHSNQYSFTRHTRDVREPHRKKNGEGIDTEHLYDARPGVFLAIDVSPMQIIHTEKRKSFAHFLTTFCAIVGGVLTVASLVDAAVFSTTKEAKL